MKLVLVLVCSFLSFEGFSQLQTTYFYPDSTISSTGILLNGRPHGTWVNYYPDGTLKSKGNWYRGLLDSTWNFYFYNGSLKLQIQYDKGIKNGYSYTYAFTTDSIHYLSKKELYLDGKIQGKVFEYNYEGTITKIINYKDDVKEGNVIVFNTDGSPKTIYVYENNRLITNETVNIKSKGYKTGTWIKIDENYNIVSNQLFSKDSLITDVIDSKLNKIKYTIQGLENQIKDTAFQGQFIDGIPVGKHLLYDSLLKPISFILYDSLGNKIEEGSISNYMINGNVWGYYINGKTRYSGSYRNNLKHGNWKFYYEDGSLEQNGSYLNGKLNGKWLWYYKNNDTLRLETYRYGKRHGLYLSYDPYRIIIQKGYYENDLKQEFWVENTGEFILEGNYFDGYKNGEWKGLYHNGRNAYFGKYLRGKPDGKHIYYYLNGNKRKIEFYETGRKIGHWQYFNKKGHLYKVKSFNKGESIFYKE